MDTDRVSSDPLNRRQRVVIASAGIAIGVIGVPLVIRAWSPLWFVVAWAVTYCLVGFGFLAACVTRPSALLEHVSSAVIGALFACQFGSALVFSDDEAHFWTATVLVLLFVLYTVVTLPFLDIAEWRWGVAIATGALFVGAALRLHPLVAVSFAAFCVVVIHGADRMRALKHTLQSQLRIVGSMADHDELTGLLNRRGLRSAIERTVERGSTVVVFDIQRFKHINDTHGYGIGDQVLDNVGKMLLRRLPDGFAVGRQSGDEFMAVAVGSVELAAAVFDPFPITVRGRGPEIPLLIEISAGIATGRPGSSVDRVLSHVAFALREAKRGGGGVARFGPALQGRFDRSMEIASLPTTSSAHGRLVPVGQPIVGERGTVGVEILVRWEQPDGTLLAPSAFLPMAVENGLMPWINDLMLEQAVAFAARFNGRSNPPFVSVNMTASHLAADDLGLRVYDLLQHHEVAPDRLMIEITESEYLDGAWPWWSTATYLRDLGVRLAVDDFGSGYSSIERLRHVPLTHLKFDRMLVKSMAGPFAEIVKGVVRFAEAAGIGIIAEGVESGAELAALHEIGIDTFQGFLFGRPCGLDGLERAMSDGVDLRDAPTRQSTNG